MKWFYELLDEDDIDSLNGVEIFVDEEFIVVCGEDWFDEF